MFDLCTFRRLYIYKDLYLSMANKKNPACFPNKYFKLGAQI